MRYHQRIPTDNPIRQIWSRLSLLSSFTGGQAFLTRMARDRQIVVAEKTIAEKAQGLSYCIRTASEYFQPQPDQTLTSSCLAYYYGTLSLLQALAVSDVGNDVTLARLEEFTLAGHGMALLTDPSKEFPDNELLAVLPNGVLPRILALGGDTPTNITVRKRYRQVDDLPPDDRQKCITIKQLLGRIPELRETYCEVFQEHPLCVSFVLTHGEFSLLSFPKYQNSAFLDQQRITEVMNWGSEARMREDNEVIETVWLLDEATWKKAQYRSVMAYDSYVKPFGQVEDVVIFMFMLLYVLSIWARYRPALWREVVEGDKDVYRPLFAQLLLSVERVLPNHILNRLYGVDFSFTPFAYFS